MTKTSASNEKAEYCPDVFLNPQGSGQWLQFYDLYCHKPYEEGVDAGIKGVFDSTGDVDHRYAVIMIESKGTPCLFNENRVIWC